MKEIARVPSTNKKRADKGVEYVIYEDEHGLFSCTCPWFQKYCQFHDEVCKHIIDLQLQYDEMKEVSDASDASDGT